MIFPDRLVQHLSNFHIPWTALLNCALTSYSGRYCCFRCRLRFACSSFLAPPSNLLLSPSYLLPPLFSSLGADLLAVTLQERRNVPAGDASGLRVRANRVVHPLSAGLRSGALLWFIGRQVLVQLTRGDPTQVDRFPKRPRDNLAKALRETKRVARPLRQVDHRVRGAETGMMDSYSTKPTKFFASGTSGLLA